MRKRIPILLMAVLLLALTACGAQPQSAPTDTQTETAAAQTYAGAQEDDVALPDAQPAQTQSADPATTAATMAADAETTAAQTTVRAADGEFGPLFRQYVRDLVDDGEYTISMRQSGMTMVTAVRGKDSALDSNVAGVLQIRLIQENGNYYMLVPAAKKYAEMSPEDYAKQADSLQDAAMDLSGMHFQKSGTETLAGKTYRTETYAEDGRGVVTYFFNDAGLARARVVKDGKTTDVESFTVRDAADADLFRIPAEYVKVEPAQLFA